MSLCFLFFKIVTFPIFLVVNFQNLETVHWTHMVQFDESKQGRWNVQMDWFTKFTT